MSNLTGVILNWLGWSSASAEGSVSRSRSGELHSTATRLLGLGTSKETTAVEEHQDPHGDHDSLQEQAVFDDELSCHGVGTFACVKAVHLVEELGDID